jgi:hypothetical protein
VSVDEGFVPSTLIILDLDDMGESNRSVVFGQVLDSCGVAVVLAGELDFSLRDCHLKVKSGLRGRHIAGYSNKAAAEGNDLGSPSDIMRRKEEQGRPCCSSWRRWRQHWQRERRRAAGACKRVKLHLPQIQSGRRWRSSPPWLSTGRKPWQSPGTRRLHALTEGGRCLRRKSRTRRRGDTSRA